MPFMIHADEERHTQTGPAKLMAYSIRAMPLIIRVNKVPLNLDVHNRFGRF